MKDTGMASLKISILFIWRQPISIVNCNQPLGPLETQALRDVVTIGLCGNKGLAQIL